MNDAFTALDAGKASFTADVLLRSGRSSLISTCECAKKVRLACRSGTTWFDALVSHNRGGAHITEKGIPMRKIVAWLFVTLDGVVESPEEWVLYNDEIGEAISAHSDAADTLLLGRHTYEVFADSWPQRSVEDDPFADWMNNTPKVVASTTLEHLDWQNSTLIKGELAPELRKLKAEPGQNILVNGSPTLIRSLLRENLLDELQLFVHPVIAGTGKRLFDDSSTPMSLRVIESRTLDNGVLALTYEPLGDANSAG